MRMMHCTTESIDRVQQGIRLQPYVLFVVTVTFNHVDVLKHMVHAVLWFSSLLWLLYIDFKASYSKFWISLKSALCDFQVIWKSYDQLVKAYFQCI